MTQHIHGAELLQHPDERDDAADGEGRRPIDSGEGRGRQATDRRDEKRAESERQHPDVRLNARSAQAKDAGDEADHAAIVATWYGPIGPRRMVHDPRPRHVRDAAAVGMRPFGEERERRISSARLATTRRPAA